MLYPAIVLKTIQQSYWLNHVAEKIQQSLEPHQMLVGSCVEYRVLDCGVFEELITEERPDWSTYDYCVDLEERKAGMTLVLPNCFVIEVVLKKEAFSNPWTCHRGHCLTCSELALVFPTTLELLEKTNFENSYWTIDTTHSITADV